MLQPLMTLNGTMLGGSDDGARLGLLLEGLYTAQVAMAVARLGVPDLLAAGPRTAEDLAQEAAADPDALGRLLAAAAVYGLVSHQPGGAFALTGVGELLRSDAPGSARPLAVGFLGEPMWQAAGRLADVVQGRRPDPGAAGGLYEYYGRHPGEAAWFARAMSRATSVMVSELAASGFRPLVSGRIVDVGGSHGALLAQLLRADPQASGVLFDRAEALAAAPEFLAAAGVDGRCDLVAGDFLREVPNGDVHVVSQVLHNWDNERVRAIAGNCHKAGRRGGSLMITEYLLPEAPEPSLAHVMDLVMLATVGGRVRSRAQHEELMGSAGYTLVRDTPLDRVMPWHILEFQRQ